MWIQEAFSGFSLCKEAKLALVFYGLNRDSFANGTKIEGNKAIQEICGKSMGHGSFSWLAAVTEIFFEKNNKPVLK